MAAADVFEFLQQAVTTILAVGATAGALWALIGKRAWKTITGIFKRLDVVEEGQQELKQSITDTQAMNRDAFKDIRIALSEEADKLTAAIAEGRAATIIRLDHINGTVAKHETAIHAQDKAIAVNAAKQEASMEVLKSLGRINTSERRAAQSEHEEARAEHQEAKSVLEQIKPKIYDELEEL